MNLKKLIVNSRLGGKYQVTLSCLILPCLTYIYIAQRTVNDWALIKQTQGGDFNSPYNLAMKYIKSAKSITALKVNNVLAFSGITITQNILDEILSRPRLEFINLTEDTIKSDKFLQLIGSVRNEQCSAGVYIWTHISSGNKYVGSSSSLARRIIGYFKGTHADVGKFIPLLRKEGVNAFNLQVIPLKEKYSDSQELSLEQYFILHPEFNLNTLKVVNSISGSSRSKSLFMYSKDLTKLIYSSDVQEDFIFKLKIHHSIFSRSIKTGEVYLGKYVFLDQPVLGATECNMTISDILATLEKDRLASLEKVGRKVIITSVFSKEKRLFNSISDCLTFLNTIAASNKTTLYRYIKSGKPFSGFICEWGSEQATHIINKSIGVSVTNVLTGKTEEFSTLRKAALAPELKTTGQTIKAYIENGKLFKGIYLIKYLNS